MKQQNHNRDASTRLLGSEGTAALGLSQEVGVVAVTELAGKLA